MFDLQRSNSVTGHLSEGSFVRNVVVQIPKFDAKYNSNPNPNPNLALTLTQTLTLTLTLALAITLTYLSHTFRTNDPSDK